MMNTSADFYEWMIFNPSLLAAEGGGGDDHDDLLVDVDPSSYSTGSTSKIEYGRSPSSSSSSLLLYNHDDDSSRPSLASSSDSSESSSTIDDSDVVSSFFSYEEESSIKTKTPPLSSKTSSTLSEEESKYNSSRGVSFSFSVEVREYSITVGDHPLCYDGLPLSLDWESDTPYVRSIEDSRERESHYKPPRRLSFNERRERLFTFNNNNPLKEQLKLVERCDQLNLMIEMLHHSWSMDTILAPPNVCDIEDDDEESEEDENEEDVEEEYYLLKRNKNNSDYHHKFPQKEEEVIRWKRNLLCSSIR